MFGPGWGVVARIPDSGSWRWPLAAVDEDLMSVSFGLPVGLPSGTRAGPLARRLLEDPTALDGVVPPFAMAVVDRAQQRAVIQQDWMGMGQVYEFVHQGVLVVTNRPTLAPHFLGEWVTPDLRGWSHYIAGGFFAQETSPVAGVRILMPGERLELRAGADSFWQVHRRHCTSVDDIVQQSVGAGFDRDKRLEMATSGLKRAGASLADLWPGSFRFGLSGGRDSRLVAAVMLSGGVRPEFFTTADDPTEAEAAERLLALTRDARGLDLAHERVYASDRKQVLDAGLETRAERLLQRYDFLFPSTYLARPSPPTAEPAALSAPTVGGAHGELVADRWIPKAWLTGQKTPSRADLVIQLMRWLGASDVDRECQSQATARNVDVYINQIADHALGLGLDPVGAISYGWLVERMRRFSTQIHLFHQVTPLLTPEFVLAAFATTHEERLGLTVHKTLTERLMPEWDGVPYVKNTSGLAAKQIIRVWDGDGAAALGRLVSSATGPLAALVTRDGIRHALNEAGRGRGGNVEDAALRNFTLLAVGDRVFADLNAQPERDARNNGTVGAARSLPLRLRRKVAKGLPAPVREPLIRALRSRR
jgi:asparagine synthase (glutamine-hydrolysing)